MEQCAVSSVQPYAGDLVEVDQVPHRTILFNDHHEKLFPYVKVRDDIEESFVAQKAVPICRASLGAVRWSVRTKIPAVRCAILKVDEISPHDSILRVPLNCFSVVIYPPLLCSCELVL